MTDIEPCLTEIREGYNVMPEPGADAYLWDKNVENNLLNYRNGYRKVIPHTCIKQKTYQSFMVISVLTGTFCA